METGGGAEGAVDDEPDDVPEVPLLEGGGFVAARTAVAAALSVVVVVGVVLVEPLELPLEDEPLELLPEDELPLEDDPLELLPEDELPPLLLVSRR